LPYAVRVTELGVVNVFLKLSSGLYVAGLPLAIAGALGVTILSDPALGVRQGYMREENYSTGYSTAPGFLGIAAQGQLDHRYLTRSRRLLVDLHDAAAALEAECLVVGSSRRGPIRRVLPGGVGERLLHGAPCAVVLAPRGYSGAGGGFRRIGVAFVDTADGREALATAVNIATLEIT
jgi:Universal stress protein family